MSELRITNKQEVIEEFKKLQLMKDTEYAHELADALLCCTLKSLGLNWIVEEFDKVKKWYA